LGADSLRPLEKLVRNQVEAVKMVSCCAEEGLYDWTGEDADVPTLMHSSIHLLLSFFIDPSLSLSLSFFPYIVRVYIHKN
jgi:hypothetical protein